VGWLTNRRLLIVLAVSLVVELAPVVYFPGDCGDAPGGWTCDTPAQIAIFASIAALGVLLIVVAILLWRLGRRFANRSAKRS
jgi:membrane associated rhomboid family serine protease